MKKLYSTIMMLAMMVAVLGLNACGGDDGDDDIGGGGSYDDTEYCQVFINGDDCSTEFYVGTIGALNKKELNGTTVRPYGILPSKSKYLSTMGFNFISLLVMGVNI